MRAGPHQAGPGHASTLDPCLSMAWVFSASESRGLAESSLDPTQRGSGPDPEVRVALAGILDLAPEVQSTCTGVRYFPMGVRTHCWLLGILGYIVLSSHMATLGPSTWRSRVLFAM
jgi:hypothetical protein